MKAKKRKTGAKRFWTKGALTFEGAEQRQEKTRGVNSSLEEEEVKGSHV